MPQQARFENEFLSRLSEEDYSRLTSQAERVELTHGEVICEPEVAARSVIFPLTNVLSSIVLMQDGSAAEVGTIGHEGMSGYALLVDRAATPTRIVQQIDGECLRITSSALRASVTESRSLRFLLEKYTLTVLQQSNQNAACNLHHNVEERMARWLLMSADRVRRNDFYLTQEFLSTMLGVRRQSVNIAGGILQRAGLIHYSRGNVEITDRAELEAVSCECYQTNIDVYSRLMDMTQE